MKVKRLENCRACGGTDFELKLTLGALYPSAFLEGAISTEVEKAPLSLVECKDCGLVQLQDTVELDDMYRQYWYRSGLNKSMILDLKDVYVKTVKKFKGSPSYLPPIHLDIGCNDGTLSVFFRHGGFLTAGFDPASNLKKDAEGACDSFVNDYFTKDAYRKRVNDRRGADIITAIAMFYDLQDPNQFLRDIFSILSDDGIFVVQLTDLYSMLKINAFDNICHEHLEYYTLNWLVSFFAKHGLTIFDAEYNKVNGGSLRIYACKLNKRKSTLRLLFYRVREDFYFKMHPAWDDEFLENIISIGRAVKRELLYARTPYALGASTKGNTLLQALKLNRYFIFGIGEVNEEKFGLYTVGTSIPIYPEKDVIEIKPDICLVLPWHFEKTFIKNLDGYLNDGGKLLFPMPQPRIAYKKKGKLKWMYLKNR